MHLVTSKTSQQVQCVFCVGAEQLCTVTTAKADMHLNEWWVLHIAICLLKVLLKICHACHRRVGQQAPTAVKQRLQEVPCVWGGRNHGGCAPVLHQPQQVVSYSRGIVS